MTGDALRLYSTRNKIAHLGEPPPSNGVLALTRSGSVTGLRTAIDVRAWLGDSGPYVVWENFVDWATGKPDGLVKLGD